ncbi:MAG: preprotein translocase subunit YajC [Verrucomicrobia bacterium]|nr:preprotein translocase subunit YajC [Verrucomicrobiota bacterium]
MHPLTLLPAFLAQTPAPAPQQPSFLVQILPMVLLFGAMYFFLIAPQRKKQKEHEKMLKELQSGDEIVTSGGIFGVITNVKEDRFVVRIADNTKIEIGKGFVQTVLRKAGAEVK